MALLGVQLVITLIVVSVIQKLGPHYSLARWILCSNGLIRYLHPTDQQLRTLAGIPKEKPRKGKHSENGKLGDVFHIPRNLDLQLDTAEVTAQDVIYLKFYSEYQWLLDLSLYAIIVYSTTEAYSFYYPLADEINLSMLWCALALAFALKVSFSLWLQYFKGEESVGERSTCIVTGFVFLLIAMIILIIDENNLEIGLDEAYGSFNKSALSFLDGQGLPSSGPVSKIVIKFFLALCCGLLGSLFTFPGLRASKMHRDALRYHKDKKFLLLLANISYASPLLLVCLWVKPISRDYLTTRVFSGMTEPLMTAQRFESLRLLLIVLAVLLKLSLTPLYLQSYLNLARQKIEMQKREAGRITNMELQRKIVAVFHYLCAAALQYVAPLVTLLFLVLMYKTLGGYSWLGAVKRFETWPEECPVSDSRSMPFSVTAVHGDNADKTVVETAQDFRQTLGSLKDIFTVDVCRGLFGLATWWTCFTILSTTATGMFYQTYFSVA